MSGDSRKGSFSEGLVLDDSEKGGVVIKGITDDTVTARSGLKEGDEIVAATIHLDHLGKDEVLKILKVLEPYDDNMKVLTKKELKAGVDLGSLGAGFKDPAKMFSDGLNGKLNAAGGLGGDISGPTLNGDLPSLTTPSADSGAKFTMPTIGMTGPNIKGTDLDGTLRAPDVSVSSPQLSTPDASLEIEKPEVKTGTLKYKPPKFKMPHFNLPQMNANAPKGEMDVSANLDAPTFAGNVKTPDLKLSAPGVDTKTTDLGINGPSVNLDGPDVDLKTPDTDIEAPSGKIKWPHLKWKSPRVKGPDVDVNGDLSAPDASLSTPKIDGDLSTGVDLNLPKADLTGPDVNGQTPDFDIDAPSGKINWPHRKWKMPRLHSPKVDIDKEANLKTPNINALDAELNLPKADPEIPSVDVQGPDIDVDGQRKINWPHLKWKKPKVHGPKADIDLNTPDADISTPKIEGEINKPKFNAGVKAPNVNIDADVNAPDLSLSPAKVGASLDGPDVDLNLPGAHVDHPELDLNTPNADIEVPSGKFKWPTLKKPKWSVSGPKVKGPDVDVDAVPAPDLSLSTPKADLECPSVDIDAPNVDIEAPSGKSKKLTLKMPKFGTLKRPKVDVDGPEIEGGIDTPDHISLPKADIKDPEIDLNAPDVNLDPHSGKLKFPKLKLPKIRGPKVKGPDVDVDLKTPDIDADVDLPNVDTDAPNLDLEAENLSLSTPKIEAHLDAPKVNSNLPKANLKGPDVDLSAPEVDAPSGKFKFPKMNWPKFGSTGPTVKGPNLDVESQCLDVPDADVDVNLPKADLTAPDANVKAPDLNLTAPQIGITSGPDITGPEAGLDVDAPTGKLNFPSLKLPKWNLSGPKVKGPDADLKTDVDLSVPNTDINLPKPDLQGPDLELKAPGLNLSAPNPEGDIPTLDKDMSLPKADVKELDVNFQAPDVGTDKSGKVKLPEIKLPKFSLLKSKVKGSDLDVNTPTLDVAAPATDLQEPDLTLQAPDLNFATPKVEADVSPPALDSNLLKAELKGPDVDLQAPDAALSSGTLKLPKTELPTPGLSKPKLEEDIGLSVPGGLKGPGFDLHVPDLNLSSPKTEGDLSAVDLNGKLPAAKVEAPDVMLKSQGLNLSTPDISAPQVDISMPKSNIKGPDIQVKTPDVDTNASPGGFVLPHFKLPEFGLSSPQVESPSIETDTKDLSLHPSVESGIVGPKVNVAAPIADVKMSEPEVDLSVSDLNAPKLEGDADINLSVPHGDIKGPKADVKAPNVDINTESSKLPHFKLPKFGFSLPKIKSSEAEANANMNMSPDAKVKAPNVKGEISSSTVSAHVPEINAGLNNPQKGITAEVDADVKDSPKSKLRWPFKWGFKSSSSVEDEGSEVDSETDLSNTEVEVPVFKFHKLPRNSIDNVGGFGDIIGIPKTDESINPEGKYIISKGIRLPIVNATSNTGEKIDVLERLKIAKEKTATVIPAVEVKADSGELAAPSLDMSTSTESHDSTLMRGGTFKVVKPEYGSDLEHPVVASSEENDKLSLSLSNMLGLNIKDPDTD